MEKLGALVEIAVETLLSVELRDFLQPGSRTPPSCSCQTIIKLYWETGLSPVPKFTFELCWGAARPRGRVRRRWQDNQATWCPEPPWRRWWWRCWWWWRCGDDDNVVMMTMPTQGGHSCPLVIVSQICVIRLFVPKPWYICLFVFKKHRKQEHLKERPVIVAKGHP